VGIACYLDSVEDPIDTKAIIPNDIVLPLTKKKSMLIINYKEFNKLYDA
jgi:hypothetical protein